jgi:hypothetical protein
LCSPADGPANRKPLTYQALRREDSVKRRIKKAIAAAAAVVVATTAVAATSASTSFAQTTSLRAYGISADGTLMATYTTDRPFELNWFRQIVGFVDGETSAIGIDFRVQNGLMYIVGNKGNIYTVKLPSPPTIPDPVITKVSQLTVPLYGTNFGVDFNPAADRLRVISDNGQNLRHNLHDHTTAEDITLTTPPAGTTRGVTAAAYTNNDLNPDTATTLFDLGTITDQVLIQSPANSGTLAPTGAFSVAGLDAGANAGFDIFSTLTNGKATANMGFATLMASNGTASLYSVNLLGGNVTSLGQFPIAFTDVAISLTGS